MMLNVCTLLKTPLASVPAKSRPSLLRQRESTFIEVSPAEWFDHAAPGVISRKYTPSVVAANTFPLGVLSKALIPFVGSPVARSSQVAPLSVDQYTPILSIPAMIFPCIFTTSARTDCALEGKLVFRFNHEMP